MANRVQRPGVRAGYDRWAAVYDQRPTALVALERRYALEHLRPVPGERVLDAGCGTGGHLASLRRVGARAVGLDLSLGMLAVARCRSRAVPLIQSDLNGALPLAIEAFDAVLCALVSEHLTALEVFFASVFGALRPGGRLVLTAFHPAMAAEGVEAHFEMEGVEYRLGAELHTIEDFANGMESAGFSHVDWLEYPVDKALVRTAPTAVRHLGQPLLLVMTALRPESRRR